MEETFEHYKNTIDEEIKDMKIFLFDLINQFEYKNIDILIESLFDVKDITEKEYDYPIKYSFNINNYHLIFDYKENEITINDSKKSYLKIDMKTKLLKVIENDEIHISIEKEPYLTSTKLEEDIKNKIEKISSKFNSVYIYKSLMYIDNRIESSAIIFMNEYELILDVKFNIINGELEITETNVFQNAIDIIKEIEKINKNRYIEKNEILKILNNDKKTSLSNNLANKIKRYGLEYLNKKESEQQIHLSYLV